MVDIFVQYSYLLVYRLFLNAVALQILKFPLYKTAKAWYTIINPSLLGGGVLALGAARIASRFSFKDVPFIWERKPLHIHQ